MKWCERQGIDYVFGLAKNPRLLKEIGEELKAAEAESVKDRRDGPDLQEPSLSDGRENLERTRRVVAKAEALETRAAILVLS